MHRLLAATAVAVYLGLACSPANVGSNDAGPTADQACIDDAYARCTREQACSPNTAIQLRYGDIGTCESLMKANCLAALAAPSTGTTIASIEACVTAVNDWPCPDYVLTQNPPPACQPSTGSLAAGAGCAINQQCQTGFCAIVPGQPCGTCAALPQPGDACTELTSCGPGVTCLTFDATCAAPAQPMSACLPSQTCTVGSSCIGANYTTGAPGTCQPTGESPGTPCSSTTNACDFYGGLVCNTSTKECVAQQLGAAGAACNYVATADIVVTCAAGGKCVSAAPGTQGICQATSPIGGPCDLVAGPGCVLPSRCIVGAGEGGTAGTCAIPDGTICP